jgi:hypothetical protein
LRKLVWVLAGILVAVAAKTTPLGFLVLDSRLAQPGRLPDGWRIKVTRGTPMVNVVSDSQGAVVQLRSRASSFGIERPLDIDPAQFPYLTWRWKVDELPPGGDFRHLRTDDQAAQILVAFEDRRILTYIWDSTAPAGTIASASSIPLLRIFAIVCRSGNADLGQWLSESRNVVRDFESAYGRRRVPRIRGIRLQINTQHTGTSAESYFGDVAFRESP